MSKKELIELKAAYKQVNEKFKPVLIFHVGESAGFFSEFNCIPRMLILVTIKDGLIILNLFVKK